MISSRYPAITGRCTRTLDQSSELSARRGRFPRGSSNRLAGGEQRGESPRTRNSLQFVRSAVLEDEG
jgi:hypothetical protein